MRGVLVTPGFVFDPSGARSFAAKERYAIDQLGASSRDDGAIVRIGDAWLSENHLEGALVSDSRSLSWSLEFEPADRCFQHIPQPLRRRAESGELSLPAYAGATDAAAPSGPSTQRH